MRFPADQLRPIPVSKFTAEFLCPGVGEWDLGRPGGRDEKLADGDILPCCCWDEAAGDGRRRMVIPPLLLEAGATALDILRGEVGVPEGAGGRLRWATMLEVEARRMIW
nr:hypothetical protein BaRGS_005034 [Batillaria attramentaria]